MENKEINLLLGKREILISTMFLGRKKDWKLGKLSLHRLLKLTESYAKIKVDEEALINSDISVQLSSSYEAVLLNARLCSRIIADAIHSRVPKFMLRYHLSRNIDSVQLQSIASKVLQESNLANFTTSITLMSMMKTTKPRVVEEKQ